MKPSLIEKIPNFVIIFFFSTAWCGQQQIDDTGLEDVVTDNLNGVDSSRQANLTTEIPDYFTVQTTPFSFPSTTDVTSLPFSSTSEVYMDFSSTTPDNDNSFQSTQSKNFGIDDLLVELRAANVLTATDITPYSDFIAYNKLANGTERHGNGYGYGHACKVYGTEVKKKQETEDKFSKTDQGETIFTSKENDNEFLGEICKISRRLECIPDRTTASDTTTTTPAPVVAEPVAGEPVAGEPVATKPDDDYSQAHGTCRCIRALSDRAIFIPADKSKKQIPGCYIPAGFNQASTCGHIVPVPYGIIQTVGKNTRLPLKEIPIVYRHVGNTSLLCVPYSECRISSRYIGKRCRCKKDTEWLPNNGTCVKLFTRLELENNFSDMLSTSTVILLVPVILLFFQSIW